MGIFQRIILIMKGYAASTGEKLDRVAEEEALREARARREAEAEVAKSAKQDSPAPRMPSPGTAAPSANRAIVGDYRTLGLEPGASLDKVEAAWRELAHRADPKRFPEGSEEERTAARILRAINNAYERIREAENPTEGRFGRLEL